MKKLQLLFFVAIFYGLFVPFAYALNLQKEIIGKWKEIDGTETFEFFKDGTVSIVDKGVAAAGNYKFVDDTRLRMDIGGIGTLTGPTIMKVGFVKNELTLTSPTGKVGKYRRIKVDSSGNDAETYIMKASKYIQEGNFREAFKESDKAVDLDPQMAGAYTTRAECYKYLGKYEQSIKDIDKAINLEPKKTYLYTIRGILYARLNNHQQAIKDYDKAIELDSKNILASEARAIAYSRLGNYQRALEDCNKVISQYPNSPGGYSSRAYVYSRIGNYQQAIKDCEKAIKLKPIAFRDQKFPWDYFMMAVIFSFQNDAAMACQWLKRAIEEESYNDWEFLKRNKDLDNIRESTCFKAIIKK